MRITAKQIDADRRAARTFSEDALREAVCRWIKEHKASDARAARAFGISVKRVASYEFETLMRKQHVEYWRKMADSPIVRLR